MKLKIRMIIYLPQEADTREGKSLGIVLNHVSVITYQSR